MINIIKTAIITIVISFISGLLLDYYKNLAPRILCTIGNGIPMAINNKRIFAYIITVSNVSNKIIHELNLNIQSSQNNLKITDAKITKGLKFDSSIKDNILDVYIPFLSNGDKFSVTLYVENQYAVPSKPVIIIRSPENFKRINSIEQNGILSLLFNIPKNINQAISKIMKKNEATVPNKKDDLTKVINKASGAEKTTNKESREIIHKNKKSSKNKRAMIIIVSIILVMIVGVLGKSYLKGKSTNTITPAVKTTVHKQSTDTTGSTGGTNKNTDTNTSTDGTTGNTDSKSSTDGTTGNTDSKSSTGESTGNTGSNSSTSGATGNTDSKSSTGGTTGNTDSKSSTGETTGNTNSNSSTGGSTGNTNSNSSTGGSTGNTGGTTENTGN
ncbi:hypothetical protein AB8U03_13875 [Clostridium sp. Mt-5]|uniref:Uncharacterized protein n=1 Tax=Clostridium moutaii TaxID=3240932 RepID=A0ABV4BR53_9CLOT